LRALDVDFYADEFARAGFRGGLNWYRNVDRNSSIPAGWNAQIAAIPGRRGGGGRIDPKRMKGAL
jgi:hypothetical protein